MLIKCVGAVVAICMITSCSTPKPVPVSYDCPQIDLPRDPVPATRQLTVTSKPDEVMKAWVASAMAYKKWDEIVRTQVENSD